MFVLCKECGESMDKEKECDHDEGQRTLHGTWVVEEVAMAVKTGYRIVQIQEIWRYKTAQYDSSTMSGGLFTNMMNDFIKYKQVSKY